MFVLLLVAAMSSKYYLDSRESSCNLCNRYFERPHGPELEIQIAMETFAREAL